IGEWAPLTAEDLTGSFAAFVLTMLTVGPVALIVSGVLRMRTEELEGRLAGLLLAGTSRSMLALLWYLVAFVEVAVMQVLLGLGVGLGVWQATEDTSWIGEMT